MPPSCFSRCFVLIIIYIFHGTIIIRSRDAYATAFIEHCIFHAAATLALRLAFLQIRCLIAMRDVTITLRRYADALHAAITRCHARCFDIC